MTIIERNKQQAAIEQALKLAFIKLQQTDGFRPIGKSKVPDMQRVHPDLLDAIRAFDPGFRFGKDSGRSAYRDAISIAITVDRVRKEQIKISTGVTEEDQQVAGFQNTRCKDLGDRIFNCHVRARSRRHCRQRGGG